MTQIRQITDTDNRFGISIFTTLAQASLINEAPLRLKLRSVNLGVVKLRSVNLGVVDSLVPSPHTGASVSLVPFAII